MLLLTRGGGSMEDLWSFNDEQVARAIFVSTIPIVSAVGHEIDFTIADFVADQRAPTPSAAAEMLSPHGESLRYQFAEIEQRLSRNMRRHLDTRSVQLENLQQRLRHPRHLLENFQQRLDTLELRLQQATRRKLLDAQQLQNALAAKLMANNPKRLLPVLKQHNQTMATRLNRAMQHTLDNRWTHFTSLSRALETVSPLSTLKRGYAIVTDPVSGKILHKSSQATVGEQIQTRLADGTIICTVDEIKEGD